jgi:hypothetical protein
MKGKRVQFDDETWQALDLLSRDQMKDFQELADEAFRDLLRKHGTARGPQGSAAPERWRVGNRPPAQAR